MIVSGDTRKKAQKKGHTPESMPRVGSDQVMGANDVRITDVPLLSLFVSLVKVPSDYRSKVSWTEKNYFGICPVWFFPDLG